MLEQNGLSVTTTLEELRKRPPHQLIFDFESVVMAKCKITEGYTKEYQQLDDLAERIIMVLEEHLDKEGLSC